MTTTVPVTESHCRAGEAGDCFRCAVALALRAATGDDHAHVYEEDGVTLLEVWGRHVVAPADVRQFVWAYDDLGRAADGRVVWPADVPAELRPFAFDLPADGDPEWQERCYGCEELVAPTDLDDEGNCDECRDPT